MPLQVWNAFGELIVDGNNINLFLRHAGTVSGGTYPQITVPAVRPYVFFRPLAASGQLLGVQRSGGLATITFSGPSEYYVFDGPAVSGGGLDGWNAAGEHVFTSRQRPLNVIGGVVVPNYTTAYRMAYADGWSYAGLSSGKWAYNVTYLREGLNTFGSSPAPFTTFLYRERITATANGFHASFGQTAIEYPAWGGPNNRNEFNALGETCYVSMIDVSGVVT